MNVLTRLLFALPVVAVLCCGRGYAQTIDPSSGSLPDWISTTPFDRSSGLEGGELPWSNNVSSLPPQHSNENWQGGLGMPGLDGDVRALVWKDGNLYVGGEFLTAAGIYANHVAWWDGKAWHPMGGDVINGVDGYVRAMAVEGDKVYVAGEFRMAGGIPARNIAVWDRTTNTWSALGGGVGGVFGSVVNTLTVHNGQVYVGGHFIAAGQTVAVNVARWDGSRWQRVGTGINDVVQALHAEGNYLYAAGKFTIAGDIRSRAFARFNISSGVWEDMSVTISGTVSSMTADAQYLYIGGTFETVNGKTMRNIARMNKGTGEWSALGQGFVGGVSAILLRGNEVIAGGNITGIYGQTLPTGYEVRRIAKWDGQKWSPFARQSTSGKNHASSGLFKVSRAESIDDPEVLIRDIGEAAVYALALGNNGEVFIGGTFDLAGPAYVVPVLTPAALRIIFDPELVVAGNICKLSGNDTVWTTLGGGLDNHVYALADEGSNLYVGGKFLKASESQVNHIVRFNKTTRSWEALGAGTNGDVLALALDGNNLYVGGTFQQAGGITVNGLARWDIGAKTWSRIGNRDFSSVSAIAVVDGNLYVGGAEGLARWNGSAWTRLYDGADGPVQTLLRDGNTLYVGGSFSSIGGTPANNIAALNIGTGGWSALGAGTDGTVYALALWNGNLCVGGTFKKAGGGGAANIAGWDLSAKTWSQLGVGIQGEIRALTTGRFGLYAAGKFEIVQTGLSANSVGLWNGTTWQTLGNGVLELISTATVYALSADNDYLYTGGTFHFAGGKSSYYLARWTYPPQSGTLNPENPTIQRRNGGSASSSITVRNIYPNPVDDRGILHVELPEPTELSADIFNGRGERMARTAAGEFDAGTHELNLRTDDLPEGIYFIRIETAGGTKTQSFIVRH